jgi:hypothetical protein
LFRLAHVICGNVEMASSAVCQAFEAAFSDTHRHADRPPTSRDLARLTYLACTLTPLLSCAPSGTDVPGALTPTEPQRRALLALTMYGDHTYREAATLLHIDPASAAQALRTTLQTGLDSGVTARWPHAPDRGAGP